MSNNISKRILPLLDRVLVRKIKSPEKTASGIYIPEKSQELVQGEVLSVGPGDKDHKMTLKSGDIIILPSFSGGIPVKMDEETLYIYRENEIPAKVSSQ